MKAVEETPLRTGRVVVFTGPSLSHARAADIAPHAELRPPIRRADLEAFENGDLVAIIDGVFDSERAVSPREIRDALGRGVRLVGASSMGALRAVEVPGMLGVGRVFEMYRRGDLQRDDEVAVLLDRETGAALTEPLVNIRFAVERLVGEGSLSAEKGAAIVSAAKGLHFHDRTYSNILRVSGLRDLDENGALLRALRSFDLKAEDAVTLLETLGELYESPHWTKVARTSPESPAEPTTPTLEIQSEVDAAKDVSIWESGESISFGGLLDFLGASGQLHAFARRALFRFLAGGGVLSDGPKSDAPSVQQAFDGIAETWGWNTHEEIHVTLRDLGFGKNDLTDQLADERTAFALVSSLCKARPPEFLKCLRFELFSNDLSLKRQCLRLGALIGLAKLGGLLPCSQDEQDEARKAYLCGRPEASWDAIQLEAGGDESQLEPAIELLGRARRAGIDILSTISKGRLATGVEPCGLAHLVDEEDKIGLSESEAARAARDIADRIGITRIAHVGELERFGLYVTSAYRASGWSSTVGSGKSVTADGAVIGCVMEEVEKYCQESSRLEIDERGMFSELSTAGIEPSLFDLPSDTRYSSSTKLDWVDALDLVSGECVRVPATFFSIDRQLNDPMYSPRRGSRIFSSSGLAAGFSRTRALVHGTCEVIERHAIRLAELAVTNPGGLPESSADRHPFVDLSSCPPSTQTIVSQMRDAGYEVRVMEITSSIAVPTFAVRMMTPRAHHGIEVAWPGFCAHPSAEQAINRALMEAVQSRVTVLSGAREDLALTARSLGRHERPRTESNNDAIWFRPYVHKKHFRDLGGLETDSAYEALAFTCRRVTAGGFSRILYRDLSCSDALPARAVRVVIPGVETTNPFHTGLHARALLVAELLHKHEW